MSRKPLTRRGEYSQKIDYSEAEQMLRAGATQQEVADRFGVSQAAISNAVARGRIDMAPRRPEGRAIPWTPIKLEHRQDYLARMLRAAHRREQGMTSSSFWESRLDGFLRAMEDGGWVVDYDPDEGFKKVPRRLGVDQGLVREPHLDDRGRVRRRPKLRKTA